MRATIPNYCSFHDETIDLIKTINEVPDIWLDTGCGTGTFGVKVEKYFPSTKCIMADPSESMLSRAKDKLNSENNTYIISGTQDLSCQNDSIDVITSIQSHHYLDLEGRQKATRNCFRMLKAGGVYVTFENIRKNTDIGNIIGLERWKNFQVQNGKSICDAEKHIGRFNNDYFPITLESHIGVLVDAGFSVAEVLWVSAMQAGFYAVK